MGGFVRAHVSKELDDVDCQALAICKPSGAVRGHLLLLLL